MCKPIAFQQPVQALTSAPFLNQWFVFKIISQEDIMIVHGSFITEKNTGVNRDIFLHSASLHQGKYTVYTKHALSIT